MQVGTVVQLKIECLENPPFTIGVVFNQYDMGLQIIFENGQYDGFSFHHYTRMDNNLTEVDYFINPIGFSKELAGYKFKNVIQLAEDFRAGRFDSVLKHRRFEFGAGD